MTNDQTQADLTLEVRAALLALSLADPSGFGAAVARVAYRTDVPGWQSAGSVVLSTFLRTCVRSAWEAGWEPADLLRVSDRRLSAAHTGLLKDAVATELRGYAAATIDPRWRAQARELDISAWWPSGESHLTASLKIESAPWLIVVERALEVISMLSRLPRLERLGPIPGDAVRASGRPRSEPVDQRILSRVRALLAKAESTTFPAEAETFTAGAQALMARHSIDLALLAATTHDETDRPSGRRVGVENPYEGAKASLLDAVARANRCRVVWNQNWGFCTVMGFEGDLDAVELLFTSLLLQATAAMNRAGSRKDGTGRSRTRSFRQSFLLAYASRIGQRLSEAMEAETAQAAAASTGQDLLPVLAFRDEAVNHTLTTLFPRTKHARTGSARDGEGWASGTVAADLAALATDSALRG